MDLVLKETEAEDLLAASSLTALLSPDMGGHLRMGRQIQYIYIFTIYHNSSNVAK